MTGRRGSPTEVAILLPSFAPFDAIGTHVVELRSALLEAGIDARIYADEIKPGLEGEAIPSRKLMKGRRRDGRFILYQLSTNSNLYHHLLQRHEPLLVQYHNITPRAQVMGFDAGMATAVAWGRRQLEDLRIRTRLALAVSHYNADELAAAEYESVVVAPPLIRPLHTPAASRDYAAAEHRLLYVGRLAPNKAHEDLIAALAVYNETFAPRATLTLVGSTTVAAYGEYLRSLAQELGVSNAVTFASGVSQDDLARLYAESHLFVSASRHEGFGFPLIEAMRSGLPVVAHASSAIPETAGKAALLTPSSEPETLATAWRMILAGTDAREALVDEGHKRAADFDLGRSKLANLQALANLVPIEGVVAAPLYYRREATAAPGSNS
ncbi:MAG: glycosyltransferase [Actinomycetota bacterium]|nr:glycosyltransferase [Actinomycetota bacterium]